MSGFEIGEVVVCVDNGPGINPASVYIDGLPTPLVLGRFYKITGFVVAPDKSLGVLIDNMPPERTIGGPVGWQATRFRKLPRADAEFTAQMRACKPQHQPVNRMADAMTQLESEK